MMIGPARSAVTPRPTTSQPFPWEGKPAMQDQSTITPDDRKEVDGFPRYRISKAGVCESFYHGKWSPLKPYKTGSTDHLTVKLYRDGKWANRRVHRLVLEAFVGPCPEGMQGCHNDGNPENNALENLRWDTIRGNMLDAVNHGTNALTKLAPGQVDQIRVRCLAGEAYEEVARAFGVSPANVTAIMLGKSWTHHGDFVPLRPKPQRERSITKLTADQVREIRALVAAGHSQKSLAVRFGVGWSNISAIVCRRSWTDI